MFFWLSFTPVRIEDDDNSLKKKSNKMTTEEFENTLLQVCFIRIVTCCDYLN